MKNRPIVFIALAVLHFCEPIIKLIVFKLKTQFDFITIINNVTQMGGFWTQVEFWLLFPLAGVALLGVKRWSYPLFVGVQFYSIFNHLTYTSYSWPYVDKYPHGFSLLILFINITLILYFLLPDVRRPFFDKEIRWWEHRVRYPTFLALALSKGDPNKMISAHCLNISHSGAFIDYNAYDFTIGDSIQIHLSAYGENLILHAQVISRHQYEDTPGIGVKFHYQNIWENLAMRRLIARIRREHQKHKLMAQKFSF